MLAGHVTGVGVPVLTCRCEHAGDGGEVTDDNEEQKEDAGVGYFLHGFLWVIHAGGGEELQTKESEQENKTGFV